MVAKTKIDIIQKLLDKRQITAKEALTLMEKEYVYYPYQYYPYQPITFNSGTGLWTNDFPNMSLTVNQ